MKPSARQGSLFAPESAGIERPNIILPRILGETFDPDLDTDRLNAQARRVWLVMAERRWLTLAEIAAKTGDPEASISARLRDIRREICPVNRRRRGPGGTHEYRVEPRERP